MLGADDHERTVSLGMVLLLDGVVLLAFPPAGRLAGFGQDQLGLRAALAMHDTSSVVGACLACGPRALEVRTEVKLARALWIVPLVLAIGWWTHRRASGEGAGAPRPWLIPGFVAMAAVRALGPGRARARI